MRTRSTQDSRFYPVRLGEVVEGVEARDAVPEGHDSVTTEELATLKARWERERASLTRRCELLESTLTEGFWDWQPLDEHEYISPRFWRMLGAENEVRRHQSSEWQARVHPDDLPGALAAYEAHVESMGAEPYDRILRFRHSDGHWVPVRRRGRIIEWDSIGRPKRVVGVHADVTRLSQVQRELEQRNEDLSQFAYRTSHDLKAPLATIQGIVTLTLGDLADGDMQEVESNLGRINDHAARLELLVNSLISLTRSDLEGDGWMSTTMEGIVEGTLERIRSAFPETDVQVDHGIEGQFADCLPSVRLEQILFQLLSNSIRFSDPAEAQRFVTAKVRGEEAGFHIEVTDNGRGIPEEFHSRLFAMFERHHADVVGGAGLGMSIVQRHVHHLRGDIDFETSTAGSTFRVRIPYPTDE